MDKIPGPVLQGEVLVLELVAVDRLAAGSVPGSEVSTLAHKVRDDAVEGGALVAVALLPGAQRAEVLAGLGHHVASQLHDDLAQRGAVGGHVEEDPGGCHYFRLVRRRVVSVLVTMLSSAECRSWAPRRFSAP